MYKAIFPSKTARDFYNNHQFSDIELASLVWNCETLSWNDKLKYLKELTNSSNDKVLVKEIQRFIDNENKKFELIKNCNNEDYIYFLECDEQPSGFFDKWDDAYNFAMDCFGETDIKFSINVSAKNLIKKNSKIYINTIKITDDNKYAPKDKEDLLWRLYEWNSSVYFRNGKIYKVWARQQILDPEHYKTQINEWDFSFTCAYINAPLPFKAGDIVKDIITGNVGVVWHEEQKYSEDFIKSLEFFDWQPPFYTLDKNGRWGHDHFSPQILELVKPTFTRDKKEDKIKREAIYALSEYFKDENNIDNANKCLRCAQKYASLFQDGIYEPALVATKVEQIFG